MRIFRHLIPLLFVSFVLLPAAGRAEVDVSLNINVAPPPLPVYAQPAIPDEGYIWAPGYWAWGPSGYYWVPGTWVLPPRVGLLWTPGYWGWAGGFYVWHAGYWGPHVGYYGGVHYGFGYIGVGYFGGFWDHDHFHYNTAVNNFGGTHITNVYRQTTVNNTTIINNTNVTRVSFNGGHGGLTARPNAEEQAAEHDQHVPATDLQARHQQTASTNRALLSSVNHGRPSIAATPHPAAFTERGVVGARGPNGAHPAVQAGGKPPQGPAKRVAAAGAGQHPPPHHPPAQPGAAHGGQPHPAVHQANAHPGPQNQGKPAEHPDNGQHPDNQQPDHH